MRPDKPHKPWRQIWRDWLDHLPLRDEPAEPELPAASFGVAAPSQDLPGAGPGDGAPPSPPTAPAATEPRTPAKSSPHSG